MDLNKDSGTSLSIVIPVYNEQSNISRLHAEIVQVCTENSYAYEIIIVDDGSTDKTAEISRNLSPVKYIRLRRNFGQTAAMDAGIKAAGNKYIVTMDGDLQNDPKDIPPLIHHLEEQNFDAVSGWRKNRRDSLSKKIVSRLANYLRSFMWQLYYSNILS